MQPVEAKQIPLEQAIFTKGWEMLKKYYNISTAASDAEWEEVIEAGKQLYYMGTDTKTAKLSKSIALGVLEYIELISKEREVHNEQERYNNI